MNTGQIIGMAICYGIPVLLVGYFLAELMRIGRPDK